MADSSRQPSRCCKPKVKAQQFRVLQSMPMLYDVAEFLDSKPTGPLKLAMILSDKARQLLAIDRYERRAFSRRKFVIRFYYKSCK